MLTDIYIYFFTEILYCAFVPLSFECTLFSHLLSTPSLSHTQVILSLAFLRPRFNLDSPYFTSCYNQEVSCLKQQAATVGSFLEDLIGVERAHSKSVCVSDEDRSKGLPICVPLTHPISLSGENVHFIMWEFMYMCVFTKRYSSFITSCKDEA